MEPAETDLIVGDLILAHQLHRLYLIPSYVGEFAVGVSIMLVCAVLASLTAGVLVAYGVCILMFQAFRMHAVRVASTRTIISTQIPAKS
jgi:hypothetical protein